MPHAQAWRDRLRVLGQRVARPIGSSVHPFFRCTGSAQHTCVCKPSLGWVGGSGPFLPVFVLPGANPTARPGEDRLPPVIPACVWRETLPALRWTPSWARSQQALRALGKDSHAPSPHLPPALVCPGPLCPMTPAGGTRKFTKSVCHHGHRLHGGEAFRRHRCHPTVCPRLRELVPGSPSRTRGCQSGMLEESPGVPAQAPFQSPSQLS